MSHEIKARGYTANEFSVKKPKASSRWEPFDGVVTVDASEFTRIVKCMMNRGEPTAGARRGAALLRSLSKSR